MGKRERKGSFLPIKLIALLIAAAFVMMVFGGCGSKSGSEGSAVNSEKKTTAADINLGYLASTGHLLYFVAKEEGFFKEEGLNVTLNKFDNAQGLISALESGKLDAAAVGSPQTTSYIEQGHDLTVYGGIMSEGHALVVKKSVVKKVDDSNYGDLSLLKGKKIAVVKDGTEDMIWRTALKNEGIEVGEGSDKVQFKNVDNMNAAYTALNNKDVDGALLFTPFNALAENDGLVTLQYSGDVKGFDNHPCCRNITTTANIKKNPDTYKSILKALIKAYRFYKGNEDKTVDDISKYVDVKKDVIRKTTYADWISMNPDPDKKSFENWKNVMVNLGYIKDFDISSHINTKLYKQALDEILEQN